MSTVLSEVVEGQKGTALPWLSVDLGLVVGVAEEGPDQDTEHDGSEHEDDEQVAHVTRSKRSGRWS